MSGPIDDLDNPYQPSDPVEQQPPAAEFGPAPVAGSRFGDYLNRAFSAYGAQWTQWLPPVLIAAVILVVSYCLCLFPVLLTIGPLSCGLYACAFRGLRGEPIDSGALGRGWERLGTSMLAGALLTLLQYAPMLLIYAAMFLFIPIIGVLDHRQGGPGGAPVGGGAPAGDGAAVLVMLSFFGSIMLMMLALLAWMLWIGTRTMFVMPLVADRSCDFSTAFRISWDETRHRFWELLLLHFLAGMLAYIGFQLCYVGAIFTMPLYFLTIAAAYDGRLGMQSGRTPGSMVTG